MATQKKLSFVKFRENKGSRDGKANWENADAEIIRDLIVSAGAAGGAVRFGYSRDRGAYSLGVYVGSERETQYLGLYGDLDEWLLEWKADLDAYRDEIGSDSSS